MTNPAPIGAMPVLVATDLDGTLLDHHNYRWQSAQPALDLLKTAHAPIVINTSKTFEEVRTLQAELQLVEPFIIENGSAVYLPCEKYTAPAGADPAVNGFWPCVLGLARATITDRLTALREERQWAFKSFSDMTLDDLVAHTQLPRENATQAMQRRYSEPLIWQDTPETFTDFKDTLTAEGYRILQGGRFVHVLGDTDKGRAVNWLKTEFYRQKNLKPLVIALGDSPNDIEMLKVADYAVLVRSPVQDFPQFESQGTQIRTRGYGPEGWCEAITALSQHTKTKK